MKKAYLLIILFLFTLSYVEAASLTRCDPGLSCSGADRIGLFNITNGMNSHVDLFGGSGYYPFTVCCQGTNLGSSCSGTYDTVLRTSGSTNAHVEKKTLSTPTYNNNKICLSTNDGNTVTCGYVTSTPGDDGNVVCRNPSNDYDACIATIKTDTNSHVSTCSTGNSYATKVCCKINTGGGPLPVCGNGTPEPGEECDCGADGICTTSELRSQTCITQGLEGGNLGCYPQGSANQCTFDTSQCIASTGCVIDTAVWKDETCTLPYADGFEVENNLLVCVSAHASGCALTDTVDFTLYDGSGGTGPIITTFNDVPLQQNDFNKTWVTAVSSGQHTISFKADLNTGQQILTSRDLQVDGNTQHTKICGDGRIDRYLGEVCDIATTPDGCSPGQVCGEIGGNCLCGTYQGENEAAFRVAGQCIDDNNGDAYGTREVTIIIKDMTKDPPVTIPPTTTTTEQCILGQDVPFFSWMHFFIVMILITGFYFLKSKSLNSKKI